MLECNYEDQAASLGAELINKLKNDFDIDCKNDPENDELDFNKL